MSCKIYKPIYAHGYWYQSNYEGESKWDINYSSVLTELIHMAGTYVDNWASDLFRVWNYNIEKHLTKKEWKGSVLYIGFREQGVDSYEEGDFFNVIERNKEDCGVHYYRRIVKLETKIDKDEITMELSQVQ